jgi:ubiquinone/menaquinone biosynthesis C-methylase UbiE
MNTPVNHIHEQKAAMAFTGQSDFFDELYSSNGIIQYKRKRVRELLLRHLKPSGDILELNAGTGEDAVFLAGLGHRVHATDISSGMQNKMVEKAALHELNGSITHEICSFTALDGLKNKGPFDCIFSNFAGLNCTDALDRVMAEFDDLLRPGGIVVLVMFPRFCLWETLLFLKGKFRTATRRFFSSKGRKANINGVSFTCWYYPPGYVKNQLKGKFSLLEVEGLCSLVPPSYIEKFPEKYPKAYAYLCGAEDRLKSKWPWKYIGDYYIISFRKK